MSTEITEFSTKVEQLTKYEGRNTELVSVYIPSDGSLDTMQNRLQNESAQAENIKTKRTRKNVQQAVDTINRRLSEYKSVPENGIALFAGVVDDDGFITVVIDDAPAPIQSQVYHCDSTFNVEPLKAVQPSAAQYIAITIDRGDAAIGVVQGSRVVTHQTIHTPVPGKQKKGGQSQQRFQRLRIEAIDEHYQRVASAVNNQFTDVRHEVTGVLIGGPEITRGEFIDGNYLHHELQDKIVFDTSVTTIESGIEELAEKASEVIAEEAVAQQRRVCQQFFEQIANGTATYGMDAVAEAIEYGAVETLLVSESKFPLGGDLEQLVNSCEEFGGEVVPIPESFDQGKQFAQGFGGVGAILRYQIE